MYFGLNVSYLGLFVLKKFGNLHQIYFYCSPENLLQGYIRADIYMVGICFPNRQVGSLAMITKTSRNGHGACPCWVTCLPMLGTVLAPVGQNPCMKSAQNISPNRSSDRSM